jgi:hypothetical protein
MKAIAEITNQRAAQKLLEHVGVPSDAPEPWPARGRPAPVGVSRGLDDEPGVHSGPRSTRDRSARPEVEPLAARGPRKRLRKASVDAAVLHPSHHGS